ncbi:GNAT family N-acetyltransferase [Shewanella electrodiphila]|uniref:GNAT family N-acetyltransferase n=1 Tax=Shewanella electrodiphila TaxID=934143 RepID=A0ABT0KSC7_9GAMM|nr:GNAT family N-acetyltransferase [Shewanella electrodiphila]MCL1046767.1 GNAT family N-acetyltransferase [Shewanella electrodiphila]
MDKRGSDRKDLQVKGFKISTDKEDIDINILHQFLTHSYWAKDIPMAVLQKAIEHSSCFSVLTESNQQVGFARLITDHATFGYLADVFVVDEHRGKGLSKWLIDSIVNHKDVIGLRRMMLATSDAHKLYAQFGFLPITNPEILMQIWRPTIYQQENTGN